MTPHLQEVVWFGLKQNGEWMRMANGKVFCFSPKEAHEMLIDDRIPAWWWATREFVKYKEADNID